MLDKNNQNGKDININDCVCSNHTLNMYCNTWYMVLGEVEIQLRRNGLEGLGDQDGHGRGHRQVGHETGGEGQREGKHISQPSKNSPLLIRASVISSGILARSCHGCRPSPCSAAL